MNKVFWLFLIFIHDASLLQLNCPSILETDVDFFGNDIEIDSTGSANSCCLLCYLKTNCTSFTYTQSTKTCWLKNFTTNFHNRVRAEGHVSGSIKKFRDHQKHKEEALIKIPDKVPKLVEPLKAAISSKSFSCIIEKSVSYNTKTLNQFKCTKISDCCDFCGKSPLCLAWTYLIDIDYCLLKSTLPLTNQRSNTSNTISGVLYN